MKRILLLVFISVFSLSTIHAEMKWELSDDGILTISGTNMPNYKSGGSPWYTQRTKIKKVIIEDGVKNIGEVAFQNCNSLTSITIPESVTSIGSGAFVNSGLVSITIPNSVTEIGNTAFFGCGSLTSITIGNSVKCIEKQTFYECSHLTSITIPNSVTGIGDQAFYGCSRLTSISIPNSMTSIGSEAFNGCLYLTSIIIPNSVTNIGTYAFKDCKSLTSIIIPESVKNIASGTFSGCSDLTSITIPNSVTNIGGTAFGGCSSLTSITIPESVTYIGDWAFTGCSGLTSITIPNSVTSIGERAFFVCSSLASITISESVKTIGAYAFMSCRNLTSLTCKALTPPDCGYDSFENINKSIPLYVPANSISAYKEAIQWKEFTNILPISVDPTLALTLTDKNPDLKEGYYQKGNVTLARNNMAVGDYATFCLPFDIDLSKTKDNFSKVYVPLNIGLLKPSGNILLLLDEMNENSIIKAGQTFVAKCKTSDVVFENCADVTFDESTSNPTPSNVKIYNFDGVSGVLTQNSDVKTKIGGSYSQVTNLNKNNYSILFANGLFDSTTSITPFQMYVYMDKGSLGSKVTSISFEFNDVSTDIKELQITNDKSPIYDLNGRMVNRTALMPGIYIRNGKKVVVK